MSAAERWKGADDAALVETIVKGNREAFRWVVLRHQTMLADLLYRQTGSREGIDDMVQETFLRAYQALDRYRPEYRLSTWLAGIGLNLARDRGRRQKLRRDPATLAAIEPPRPSPTPLEDAARQEARASVQRALTRLPDPQREIVVLSVYGGFSQREIARTLSLPLGTVKGRYRAAFDALRRAMASLRPEGAA